MPTLRPFAGVLAAATALFAAALPAPLVAQDSASAAVSRTPAFSPIAARHRAAASRLIDAALADSAAYARLALLTDTFGPRFSGTPALERAIDWILGEMRRDGLENVRGERVMVPVWVRGAESLEMVHPRRHAMRLLGLGGSIGTPRAGITAPVL